MSTILGCITANNNLEDDARVIVSRMAEKAGIATHVATNTGSAKVCIVSFNPGQDNQSDKKNGTSDSLVYSEDNTLYAVANGNVYNHLELRSLNKQWNYRTSLQAESLLAAWQSLGVKSLTLHDGPCVMAVLDKKTKHCFISRDRYGQMTLFYTSSAKYFAFSNDIKALLAVVPAKFNHAAISYETFEFTVGEETVFEGINSVLPGECLEISEDLAICKSKYWNVWDNLVEIAQDEIQVIDTVHGMLEDAVKKISKAHNARISLASGGIDSSIVTMLAKPDYIYHVHYDYADFNELDYATCLAKTSGAELKIVKPGKEDYLEHKDAVLNCIGMPTIWTSFTLWMVLRQVNADGFSNMLTGDGADELFAGYHRYLLLVHDEEIRKLEALNGYSYLIQKYYGSNIERYAKLINRSSGAKSQIVDDYLTKLLKSIDVHCNADIVRFMTLTDFLTTSQILQIIADRVSSYYNIHLFSPFMDYSIVQYAFSLSADLKIRNGITKWILKKIAERILPKKIVQRTDKRGFSAPVNYWFNWQSPGKYDRDAYKRHAFNDWKRIFAVVTD